MSKLLEGLPKLKITPGFYKTLPETPGIYVYFKDEKVIYIGKAINLKRRVGSYFDLDLETKTAHMIADANNLSFIQVESELSALLLEAKLIRSYMPHYNIAAKDDKHPLYIKIVKEKYSRIITVRKDDPYKGSTLAIYGPFPSSTVVKSVLRLLRKVFPFSDHKLGKRGCLYSHIGLCSPCPSEIESVGNKEERIGLHKKYTRNIKNIRTILDGNIDKVTKDIERNMDSSSKDQNYEEAIYYRNQITQLEYITRPQLPTDFYIENPNLYEDVRKKELIELEKLVGIKNINRIECFDIAHLAGTNPTASMVTFVGAEADKKYYRHFKIKVAKGGDDYESMKEVARRRQGHFDDWGKPDLIIVDGGLGQVKSFKEFITEVPIVGIAKHPDRLIIGEGKIKLTGPVLNLVSRMRDEAHRFARRLHHKLVSRTITG